MKAWKRRTSPDRSQAIRHGVQTSFLLLNLWVGFEFWRFVRQFEGGVSGLVARPAGVEGWLPIAGMMNTKYWLLTGEVPAIHPAAMVLFLTFFGISFLFRKGFCGWLCPIGTISERLWKLGKETFKRNVEPPRWLQYALLPLKYILMGLFLYAVASMSVEGIRAFLESPYGLIADVKMLNFFRYLGTTAAVVILLLVVGSVFVRNFWCRYLCPYGAVMGLASLLSPLRIRRNPEACIDCGKCVKACPSHLAVDKLIQIRTAECIGCLECVAVCPAENALHLATIGGKRRVAPQWVAAGVALLFVLAVGAAKISGHWESPIPNDVYHRLVPRAHEWDHP